MAKLETLIDDFSDNDLSPNWQTGTTGSATGTAAETGGAIEIEVDNGNNGTVYVESVSTYDLTDSYAIVRVDRHSQGGEPNSFKRETSFRLIFPGTQSFVQWRLIEGAAPPGMNAFHNWDGSGHGATNDYNHPPGGWSLGPVWWRIAHESATDEIVFSYSADAGGVPFEWTEAARIANPFDTDIQTARVRFDVNRHQGTTSGGTPAQSALFDDFNNAGAPATPLPFIFGFGHIGDISHAIGSGSFTQTTGNATVAVEPATSRRMLRLSGSSDSILRTIPNATELVLGFRFRATAFGTEVPIVTFLPAGGGAIASLGISADGYLQVKRSTTLLQGQALDPLEAGAEYFVEISTALKSAGDFEVRVHQQEAPLFSFEGSNRNLEGVAGGCERIRFSGIPNAFVWITDVYLDDRAGGAGTGFWGPGVVDFAPADDADLGEVPDDGDTTHVDMLDGDVEQHATLPAARGGQIHAVAAFTVARLPNSGPLTMRMGLLSDGLPAAVGVRKPGDTAYAGLTSAAAKIDPQTGLPWTQAALADVEVYLKAEEE